MRLVELEPRFLRRIDAAGQRRRYVETLDEAEGVIFLCPVCFAANRGSVGTHSVVCWAPEVPAGVEPGPGRWALQGTGVADLTLVAGSSSVFLAGGCRAHFFVRDGSIVPA